LVNKTHFHKNNNFPIDRETRKSKGFAFVKFKTVEQTEKAIDLDGEGLGRRKVRINFASNN